MKQEIYNNRPAKSTQVIVGLIFLVLLTVYAACVKIQDADVFYESQFLHYKFLRDLVAHRLTANDFFTVYAEHLFPGYNLILAFNYWLFHLWGGLDSLVYAIFLAFTAAIVVWRLLGDASLNQTGKVVTCGLTSLLLLSTTNTPQWGMALAAAGGVGLFVLCAALIEDMLLNETWKQAPFVLLLIPVTQILFLGGYGIGSAAAIGALVALRTLQCKGVSAQAIAVLLSIIVSVVIYVALVERYGQLSASKPVAIGQNIGLIIKFALLMSGSSVLGKAFFESMKLIWPYYALGAVLLVLTLCAARELLLRPARGRLFMFALAVYSAVNILAVAFFRYRNGLEGALGEWYNVHTHFLAVVVVYYCVLKMRESGGLLRGFGFVAIGIILFAALVGYMFDWKKGLYVREYKEQFVAQALMILAFPEAIADKNDVHQTMLWDYGTVKPAIDFLFSHKLWIFHRADPIVTGVDHDNWLEASTPVMVLCPRGTKSLHFKIWRKEDWTTSDVKLRAGGEVGEIRVTNGDVGVPLPENALAVMIDARDVTKSHPVSSVSDPRPLVAIIDTFHCGSF